MDLKRGDWHAVADWIRSELARRRWSQADLAAEAGISTRAVSDLVNAKTVRRMPPSAAAVEAAFDAPPGTIRRLLVGEVTVGAPTIDESPQIVRHSQPPTFLSDDEVEIWNLRTIPEDERRELIAYLRARRGLSQTG